MTTRGPAWNYGRRRLRIVLEGSSAEIIVEVERWRGAEDTFEFYPLNPVPVLGRMIFVEVLEVQAQAGDQ